MLRRILNNLARLWSNWRYRNLPHRISDRCDQHDLLNYRLFKSVIKQIDGLENRVKELEKQNGQN